jgi:hypothetical protein
MKYILTICLALFYVDIAVAQSKDSKLNKFELALIISPDINHRKIDYTNIIADLGPPGSNNNHRRLNIGYTMGVNGVLKLYKKISLEAGIQFANRSFEYELDMNNMKRNDVYDPMIPDAVVHKNRYQYIDIPIRINYMFGNGKLKFVTGIGGVGNININESIKFESTYKNGRTDKGTIKQSVNQRLNLTGLFALGIHWQYNELSALRIEPNYRASLPVDISDILDIEQRFYTVGLHIGWYRAF